ncbi:MAG TPA: hypothetical protein VGK56_11090 [Anaerolineales bacterium]
MKHIEDYSDQELIENLRLTGTRRFNKRYMFTFEGYGELQGCSVNMWTSVIYVKDHSVDDWRLITSHDHRFRKVLELIAFPEEVPSSRWWTE